MSVHTSRSALAPFRFRGYRFLWPADLATSWAFEMETLILGWYVLAESGSVLMLTIFGALQFHGTLFSPMAGVLGDRVGHRTVLAGMRAFYTVLAVALMLLAFADALNPLVVLGFAALSGLVRPSDMGVRSAAVGDIVPGEFLVGAMGVSRTTADSARVAGALTGAGMFAVLGMGPAYVLVSGFYIAGFLLTLGIPRQAAARAADGAAVLRASPWRELWEGLRYVWVTPHLQAAMWVAFLVNLAAFPLCLGLLPYVAREVYQTDQTGLGYLAAAFAFGALVGSVALSFAGSGIRPGRMMTVFAAAWFASLLVFAWVENLVLGIVMLFLAGLTQSYSLVPLSVLLIRSSDPRFRGRVMGVRMLAIYSLPVGLLASGFLIDRIGFAGMATLYTVLGILLTALIAWHWRGPLRRIDAAPGDY